MFVFGNLFTALATVLDMILLLLSWLIIIRALISWLNPDPYNPIVQFLTGVTEPILRPIRSRLPVMPIDISPVIALLIIIFIKAFLVETVLGMGQRLKMM